MKGKHNQVWDMLLQRWQRVIAGSFSSLWRLFKPRKSFTKGFTLIELLVSMLIASFIIVVMLTFLTGVLDSSRNEQAKSEAQEEIQSALNYIADDMQEALYIYDATSLAAINDQLPHRVSTTDSECTSTNCTPILVFWKRYSYKPTSKLGTEYYGCLPYKSGTAAHTKCVSEAGSGTPLGAENFTFSLVAYYLRNDVSNTSSNWSKTARILRWELKDGYAWSCSPNGNINDTANCPTTLAVNRNGGFDPGDPGDPSASPPIPPRPPKTNPPTSSTSSNPDISPQIVDSKYYFIPPDKGFNRPDLLAIGTLQKNASAWRRFTNAADGYNFSTNPFTTLIDFVDDTSQGDSNIFTIAIPNNDTVAPFGNAGCADPTNGVGASTATSVAQRVPSSFSDATANPSQLTSFYACVSPEDVTARVYIRGNALARIQTNPNFRKPNSNNLSFFPSLNTRVFGRSALGLGKK